MERWEFSARLFSRKRQQVTDLAAEEARLFWDRHRAAVLFDVLANGLVAACFVLIFVWIIRSPYQGVEQLTLAVLSIIFVIQGMNAATGVGELHQRWGERWDHATKSLVELQREAALTRSDEESSEPPADGHIEFQAVDFAYKSGGVGSTVLDGLDLDIPAGLQFAVRGANGAGKSTLINLLMRFDRTDAGGIARTKHLAKIASQVAKPDGLVVVDPASELVFLHDLPVELMWGVRANAQYV
jgi:ABC-type multidrug transport system fused ATPase/permease subunit